MTLVPDGSKDAHSQIEGALRALNLPVIHCSMQEPALPPEIITERLSKPLRSGVMRATIQDVTKPGSKRRPATTKTPKAASLDGVRVLVVDDNQTNRKVIASYFKATKASVTFAENGQQAVDLAAVKKFDIILMDISMPVMDGFEATRTIRNMEADAGLTPVAIVALTANAMPGDVKKCLEAGMDDFLSKPIRKTILMQKIDDILAAPDIETEPA